MYKLKHFVLLFLLFNSVSSGFSQDECAIKWKADSLLMYGDFQEAIKYYQLSLALNEENREYFYRISICFCQLNLVDSAGYYFNKALEKSFYYIEKSGGLADDIYLKCLKNHPDYLQFVSISETVNLQKARANFDKDLNALFLQKRESDQYVRSTKYRDSIKNSDIQNSRNMMDETDSLHMLFLDSILDVYNKWPGYDLIGKDGDNAAWLIAQHADSFIKFQEKCYKYLLEANTLCNTNPHNVAYLYDRIRINKGLKQKYATQMRIIDGEVHFINLENMEIIDIYRNCYNLPSLLEYKKILETRYLNE